MKGVLDLWEDWKRENKIKRNFFRKKNAADWFFLGYYTIEIKSTVDEKFNKDTQSIQASERAITKLHLRS